MNLSDKARYRWDVTARAAAAIGGGYLLTAAATTLIAVLLPLHRADAATLGTMLSFLFYACVVLWVFATRSAIRAWGGILIITALLETSIWINRSML